MKTEKKAVVVDANVMLVENDALIMTNNALHDLRIQNNAVKVQKCTL